MSGWMLEIHGFLCYFSVKNTYDGIEIQGDYLSGVVSNTSTAYLAGNWNQLKKVKVGNNRKSVVDYNAAVNKVTKQFGSSTKATNSIGSMNNGKLAFVYNDKTGYYEPNWVFESEKEAVTYNVNCLSGALNVIEMPK
ncbi:MAG: hypothetical protein IJP29_04575 [Lachnospiraceae bacterium]|nr:hypothetical protein [Lachnospiraceae bacterium]